MAADRKLMAAPAPAKDYRRLHRYLERVPVSYRQSFYGARLLDDPSRGNIQARKPRTGRV